MRQIFTIILTFTFVQSFIGQTKFPYDSLKKINYILYGNGDDDRPELKPLEKERVEKEIQKIYRRTFPPYKTFSIELGGKLDYQLGTSGSYGYYISFFKEEIPVTLHIERKSSNPKFITSDQILGQVENVPEGVRATILVQTIPSGYFKNTYSGSGQGVDLNVKVLSVKRDLP